MSKGLFRYNVKDEDATSVLAMIHEKRRTITPYPGVGARAKCKARGCGAHKKRNKDGALPGGAVKNTYKIYN